MLFLLFCSFYGQRKKESVYFKASVTLCGLTQIGVSEITEQC